MSSMSEAHIASTGRQLRDSNEQLVLAFEQRVLPLVGNMMGTLARGLGAPPGIVASLTASETGNALANSPSVMMHVPSEGVAASSGAAAAASSNAADPAPTRDKTNPTTWPETSTWLANLRLIQPKDLGDLYREWNVNLDLAV